LSPVSANLDQPLMAISRGIGRTLSRMNAATVEKGFSFHP
jgi:hypothetical protein